MNHSPIWLVFINNYLVVTKDYQLLTENHIRAYKPFLNYTHKIAQTKQQAIYCGQLPQDYRLTAPHATLSLRQALEAFAAPWHNFIIKAYSILQWDQNHQFCGYCGHTTTHCSLQFERICSFCQRIYYPRISPSIIVLIHRNEEIVMARGYHFSPGSYGLIAGFIEPGESAEEAVQREVYEEVSLQVNNITYFGSQPWPFPDSLMFAFTASYASGELNLNTHELEAGGWYHYKSLPGRPSSKVGIANKLLDAFIQQQESSKK